MNKPHAETPRTNIRAKQRHEPIYSVTVKNIAWRPRIGPSGITKRWTQLFKMLSKPRTCNSWSAAFESRDAAVWPADLAWTDIVCRKAPREVILVHAAGIERIVPKWVYSECQRSGQPCCFAFNAFEYKTVGIYFTPFLNMMLALVTFGFRFRWIDES